MKMIKDKLGGFMSTAKSVHDADIVIERRATSRVPVELDIVIARPGRYCGRWKTTNLSLHGAHVNMAPHDLPVDSDVAATLSLHRSSDRGSAEPLSIQARIVRVSGGGVGLKFGGFGNQAYNSLAFLLYDS